MIIFNAFGHQNVLGTHKNTFEFTKDKSLTLQGDCILGVKADFDLNELKKLILEKKKTKDFNVKITITAGGSEVIVNAQINPDFSSNEEFVVRTTDFLSERTFAILSDKACKEFPREFVEILKKEKEKIEIKIE